MKTKKSHARAAGKTGFSIALPDALIQQIAAIAATQRRTRNGQIHHLLALAVERWLSDHLRVCVCLCVFVCVCERERERERE